MFPCVMDFGSKSQTTQYHNAPTWDYDFVPSDSGYLASSSELSSDDEVSSQCSSTSSASSASSLPVVWKNEDTHPRSSYSFQKLACNTAASEASDDTITSCSNTIRPSTCVQAIQDTGHRPHPRRTSRIQESPPSLIRQNNRKINFVDNLVDSASQIVETIWPLSVVSSRGDTTLGNKGVLPLRTFIQETLRRSRTSYSTLQVALYYLILIKAHVPHYDFTMEQPADDQTPRAMQCGRRMFLAALILASKYLQDRNYSSRAWSKISGLNPIEINTNELAFLAAVKWRLHISEKVFQRWTDVVLKYTSSTQPPRSPTSSPTFESVKSDWKSIIPSLTPELDHVDLGQTDPSVSESDPHSNLLTPFKPVPTRPTSSNSESDDVIHTPTPLYIIPRVLEPVPTLAPFASLPTPRMTPLPSGLSTPAVGARGALYGRQSAIGSALAKAENICRERMTLDNRAHQQPFMPCGLESYAICGRRPSLGRSSMVSSPESMVSDNSSRSSRSSSISSVASSICAPGQLNLAVQATCRSAKLQQIGRKENQRPDLRFSPESNLPFVANSETTSSPESYTGLTGAVPDFSKFSLRTPHPTPSPPHSLEGDRHLAGGLRDITNKPKNSQPRSTQVVQSSTMNVKGRKRGRVSEDLTLQQRVRGLTASRTEEDSTALHDNTVADSFLLRPSTNSGVKAAQNPSRMSSVRLPLEKEAGRKRACCVENYSTLMRDRVPGPGMWNGIL